MAAAAPTPRPPATVDRTEATSEPREPARSARVLRPPWAAGAPSRPWVLTCLTGVETEIGLDSVTVWGGGG